MTGWNHNTHYHPAVLAAVPAGARTALDVGCGIGRLAHELAAIVGRVDAIDRDAGAIERARAGATRANIAFAEADFFGWPGSGYDLVTLVAVLHHLPLDAALARISSLLAPGGTCAIVGLARTSGVEHLASFAAWPVSRWLRATRPHAPVDAPIAEPRETLAEIRAAAARQLPGARIERRLLWRYTLVWTKR